MRQRASRSDQASTTLWDEEREEARRGGEPGRVRRPKGRPDQNLAACVVFLLRNSVQMMLPSA